MNKLLKYNQAKYAIFDIIAEQQIQVGERLPSVRTMDNRFKNEFSPICLRRALSDLSDQGYLEKRPGSGIYLARSIDNWKREGEMLFLWIASANTSVQPNIVPMKKYLSERNIMLKSMICTKPGTEVLETAKNIIGLFASGLVTREWVDFLNALDIPVVYIGSYEATKGLPTIDFDWQSATEMLVDEFAARGYKKIGLINSARENYHPSNLIAEGFLRAGRKNKLKLTEEDILWKPASPSEAVKNFLDQHRDYEALIIEGGALVHVLIYAYQFGLGNCALGVLWGIANNISTEQLTFVAFTDQDRIYEYAASVFFESLNKPDYFKSGPILLKPHIVPGGK